MYKSILIKNNNNKKKQQQRLVSFLPKKQVTKLKVLEILAKWKIVENFQN